jgi:hypothetical protein
MPELQRSGDGARRERRRSRNCCEAATSCEVGSFLARVVDVAVEGNTSNVEAWRNETNKLKEAPVALIVKLPSGT